MVFAARFNGMDPSGISLVGHAKNTLAWLIAWPLAQARLIQLSQLTTIARFVATATRQGPG